MGAKDSVTRTYLRRGDIFADAFNHLLYGGRPVLVPESLAEADTAQTAVLHQQTRLLGTAQRYRDIFKRAIVKTDGQADYLLLGIESQSAVHYAMPVRNLLYDALSYAGQIREFAIGKHQPQGRAANHQQPHQKEPLADAQAKALRKNNSSDFLSGFDRMERLFPVITLVVYLDSSPWDGPLRLSDMMRQISDELRPFVQDYQIFLLSPAQLDDTALSRFHTSLRQVLSYVKYAGDKRRLQSLLSQDAAFSRLETEAALVINTVTRSRIVIPTDSEVINMCKAIQDMKRESKLEGRRDEQAVIVRHMLDARLTAAQIHTFTQIPLSCIRAIADEYAHHKSV